MWVECGGYPPFVPATAPTGQPLLGRFVRLDPVQPSDAEGLHAVLTDPVVYTQGFIMRPPPADLAETQRRVAADVAARETGRTAYTVRLVGDGPLGEAVARYRQQIGRVDYYTVSVLGSPASNGGKKGSDA